MTDARFAGAAGRLAGLTGLAFGWTPDTFWAATPAELAALVRALGQEDGTAPANSAVLRRMMEADHG